MMPRARLLWLAALPLLPFALLTWAPSLVSLGLALDLLLVAVAFADLALTPRPDEIEIERDVGAVLSAGVANPVALRLLNRSRQSIAVEVADEPPIGRVTDLPATVSIERGRSATVQYHVVPLRRGRHAFAAVHIRYASRLGLWTRQERRTLVSEVRVYPDVHAVRKFDLLARRNQLNEIGLKFWRLQGRGGEFERLREYRRGDELRQIAWKATAKRQQLVSLQYTVERNQNLLVLFDCGRTMANESDGLTHLDRAMNAALILSHIALGQGDNVGWMAFSNRIELLAGPVRGRRGARTLVQQTFDLEPRLEASDYGLACEEILRRQRKRSLVLLVTHALDEQHLEWIERYVRPLRSRHLVLLVFLRDMSLAAAASRSPRTKADAFTAAAAAEIMNGQARRVRELRTAGALVLETPPDQLSPTLVNQYLDIKARHLL